MTDAIGPVRMYVEIERWPLLAPFRITGYTFEALDVLLVKLEANGGVGCGEAAGVYYKGDTPAKMREQVEGLRGVVETGISRDVIQEMLPAGGARNALDCALWDLEAKRVGSPVWQIAKVQRPVPLLTTFTCAADEPKRMALKARGYSDARAIKLKLTGEPIDADRVRAVRESLPDVWLAVDANQGFTASSLERLMRVLVDERVALIEQPFPVGQEATLDGFQSPIPIAADESIQGLADVTKFAGQFDVVNIKLDKCGGLTEGLAIARRARELGLGVMVGNMMGTSLAMAPAFVVGQLCNIVDLDGPVVLKADRAVSARYEEGRISCPENLWGGLRSQ